MDSEMGLSKQLTELDGRASELHLGGSQEELGYILVGWGERNRGSATVTPEGTREL